MTDPPAPLPAIPTPLDGLEALVNALQQEIPGDAAQLRRLRQQRDTAAARLGWSHPTPPPTAERGPLVTAKARSLTALCTGLVSVGCSLKLGCTHIKTGWSSCRVSAPKG